MMDLDDFEAESTALTPIEGFNAPTVAPSNPATANLTPAQKAAIIIGVLGPEAAGPIVERITDNHLRAFTRAYAAIDRVPRAALQAVVEEFVHTLKLSQGEMKGGFEEARALLSEFKGADEIIRLMEDIGAPGGRSVWEKLEESNEKALAKYLTGQHPQTIAVVMSKLNADKAAFIASVLPEETSREVMLRLARPLETGAAAMRVLTETIEREFLAPAKSSKSERSPGRMVGSVMNNLPTDRREVMMAHMNEHAPEIVPIIQKYMLTFQDIAERVPPNAVSVIVRETNEDTLMKALKFGKQNAPSSVDYVLENISKRMADQYIEKLEKLDKVSVKDAEAAQRELMNTVRDLESKGDIKLNEIVMDAEDDLLVAS